MACIELLLSGTPGRTNQGYLGQSVVTLVDETTLIDTGGPSRQPLLENTLEEAEIDPENVEDILLTHLHFDHCDNIDLFPEATVHVYGPELDRVMNGNTDWATSRAIPNLLANRDVIQFEHGETVAGLEALHTPGHCKHHISYILRTDPVCGIVGDAIKNIHEFVTRDPTAIYDKASARETFDYLSNKVDFVIPGHDTPFYQGKDNQAMPCGEVELDINLQLAGDASAMTNVRSNRTDCRDLPEFVHDRTGSLKLR